MRKPNSTELLRETILLREIEHAREGELLKEYFKFAFESLKPFNFIRNTFKEAIASSDLKDNLIDTGIGIATGFVSKKLLLGVLRTPLKNILGTALQIVITSIVSKNSGSLKSMGNQIIQNILGKKEPDEINQDERPE